jgi:DNA-directed RNA polymerase
MSNNGSQHLAALTQDEVVAQHVNIIDNEIPGDLYRFVAEALWARLDPYIESLSSADLKRKEALIDDIINVMHRYIEAKKIIPKEWIVELNELTNNLCAKDI